MYQGSSRSAEFAATELLNCTPPLTPAQRLLNKNTASAPGRRAPAEDVRLSAQNEQSAQSKRIANYRGAQCDATTILDYTTRPSARPATLQQYASAHCSHARALQLGCVPPPALACADASLIARAAESGAELPPPAGMKHVCPKRP